MLTPEQAQDLVDWAGSQRKAAAEIGVAQPTISYWLHPERKRERQREYDRKRWQDPEYRERRREYQREYRQTPEYRERQREYQQTPAYREREREYYRRRLDQGLCTKCGKEPLLSYAYCWDCLSKQQDAAVKRTIKQLEEQRNGTI